MKASSKTRDLMPTTRKSSREQRRLQVLEATIETLGRRGYAEMKMTDVAQAACISHGLVNFHFGTKEKLLNETLLHLAAEYRANWMRALAEAPPAPAAQLDALLMADFNEEICTPSRLAAWCAFWGEAQSRPIYQEQCGPNNLAYVTVLEDICARLIDEGGYRLDHVMVARVLRVTMEGLWLDLLTMTAPYSREEAKHTVYCCAAAFFPRSFDRTGLLHGR